MGWWVNDPNVRRSVRFNTRAQAKGVSKQVKGSSVSKTPKPHHGGGCLALVLVVVMAVAAVVMAL